MNKRLRQELEELAKNASLEQPSPSNTNTPGQAPLVFEIHNIELISSIAQSLVDMRDLKKLLVAENLPPAVVASILFSMVSDTKACILMNLYETIEAFLDPHFHVVACIHNKDEKCEKGYDIEQCQNIEKPCVDRQVKYGEWFSWLTCESCPFQKMESEQK